MTKTLRTAAVAIAVAAILDPAFKVTGAARARVAVVNLEPEASESVRLRERLAAALGTGCDVQPQLTSDVAAAVFIGRTYPTDSIPDDLPIATVTMPDEATFRIARVSAPHDVPAATSIHVDVDLDAHGAASQSTDVVARLGGLEVARVSHRWTADRERWRASLDVVPIGDPPFVVSLEAGADAADVVVGLRTQPLRVEFYEPRPSWAATFVRRALEADARFHVESLTFSSHGVAARSAGEVPLTDPQLAALDTLIVGGLERLSAADVRAIDGYMRERGGAVALLPDERIDSGPARDLLPGTTERLLERPSMLVSARGAASLQASELLIIRGPMAGADVAAAMAGTDAAPVIVSMPRGAGRLLVSGAMDAWRFRAAADASFDRFWQSVIAGLALAAPPPLDVEVTPAILRPGEHAGVIVRTRIQNVTAVSASVGGDHVIRLWPDPEPGVYRGRLTAPAKPGRSTIEARATATSDHIASRAVTVAADARRAGGAVLPALSMLAASHGGINVPPERAADLERFLRDAVHVQRAPAERHPMRSAWWLVPFAALLSGEWWLRRRRGLR